MAIPQWLRVFLVSVVISFSILNIIQANLGQTRWKSSQNLSSSNQHQQKDNHQTGSGSESNVNINSHSQLSLPRKNIYSLSSIEERLAYHFPYREHDEVESNIFQLWQSHDVSVELGELMDRWRDANEDHDYTFLTLQEAEDLVADFLRPAVPEVVDALRLLPHDRLKFEFLKYLLIFLQGGVYSDIDTINIKPIKYWWQNSMLKTKFWIGVDSDFNDPNWFDHYVRRMTFNNNIFRAKSHHPLLRRLIARITFITFTQSDTIKTMDWDQNFHQCDANGTPLIQFTGQLVFTDTVFEYMNQLQEIPFFTSLDNKQATKNTLLSQRIYGPRVEADQQFSYKTFSLLGGAVQVYDLCVLPHVSFNGFESALRDVYDDSNSKMGLDKMYYGRGKSLTDWSPQRVKLDSN